MQEAWQVVQRHRASGLNLLVAAIILWNTTYLKGCRSPSKARAPSGAGDLAHLSPSGQEHIKLTGDYQWDPSPILGQISFGRFGPVYMTSPQRLSVL